MRRGSSRTAHCLPSALPREFLVGFLQVFGPSRIVLGTNRCKKGVMWRVSAPAAGISASEYIHKECECPPLNSLHATALGSLFSPRVYWPTAASFWFHLAIRLGADFHLISQLQGFARRDSNVGRVPRFWLIRVRHGLYGVIDYSKLVGNGVSFGLSCSFHWTGFPGRPRRVNSVLTSKSKCLRDRSSWPWPPCWFITLATVLVQ